MSIEAPATDALIADLVAWVAASPRSYAEVMEAWRTSCPRLTVWEDALDRGYVRRVAAEAATPARVVVTDTGRAFLRGMPGRGS